MKNIIKLMFLFNFLTVFTELISAPAHVVTFFIEQYPGINVSEKTAFNEGIFFSYFGYKTATNRDGQVTFPLKTDKTEFYLLVTNDSEPIIMLYNTVSHIEVNPSGKYSLYSVKKLFDKTTDTYLWSVEPTDFKDEPIVPLNTIVVHANPDALFIPTGVTPIKGNPSQLLLPKMYAKSEITLAQNALKFLESCQFFSTIKQTYQYSNDNKESKTA